MHAIIIIHTFFLISHPKNNQRYPFLYFYKLFWSSITTFSSKRHHHRPKTLSSYDILILVIVVFCELCVVFLVLNLLLLFFWSWMDQSWIISDSIYLHDDLLKSINWVVSFWKNWQQFLSGTVEALENVRKWKRTVTTMHGLVIKLPNHDFLPKNQKRELVYEQIHKKRLKIWEKQRKKFDFLSFEPLTAIYNQ